MELAAVAARCLDSLVAERHLDRDLVDAAGERPARERVAEGMRVHTPADDGRDHAGEGGTTSLAR